MNSFLWKIYLYKFLDAFKLIGAIFVLLFQQNGLNPFQISLLIGIWSATQLLLEVPTGVVADRYPRRNVLIVAMLVIALGYTFWLKGGFIFYGLGMVMWGVKNALTSGTFESFVYDGLKSEGRQENYGKVNGQSEGAFQVGLMFSAVIGGILAQYSFNLVLIFSIISSILAALILFTIKSVRPILSTGETKYFSILKNAVKEIKSSPLILSIILFISLIFGISGSADEFWPLIFGNLGANTAFIGTLIAIEFAMFALSGYSFQYWNKLKFKHWKYILVVASGLLFIIFGLGKSLLLLPLVFIASYLLKLALVKFDTDLQHAVSSDQRATVLSLKALIFEIVYLITLLMFGFISTRLGILSILYIWGAVIIFWTLVFSLRKNKL